MKMKIWSTPDYNNCQTPVLGPGLGVDFTFANNNNNNNNNTNHPSFRKRNDTMGMKYGITKNLFGTNSFSAQIFFPKENF